MANPWFRLYAEFADDPKVQIMSEAMQRRLVMLMCSRCKEEVLTDDQRAFYWRISPEELETTKRVFINYGFIDANWNLRHWDDRQFLSDSSKERVKRYRDRREALGLKRSSGAIDSNVIFKRDGKKCVYCLSPLHLCIDHVIPLQKGGTDEEDNLATACKGCNSGKSGRTPEEAGYIFKNPDAAARYKMVTDRNGYSNGDMVGGVTAQDSDSEAYSDSKPEAEQTQKARAQAKAEGSSLMGLVEEDLEGLAVKIALRHPRSRMRQWTERNVGLADRQAILDAMADDAQRRKEPMADVGRAMLLHLDAWDEVPQDRWQFVAAIPKFYNSGDYRLQPKDLPGITSAKEGASNGRRKGAIGNSEVFQGILAEARARATDRGDSPVAGSTGGGLRQDSDSEDGEALHRGAGGLHGGGDHPGVQPSAGVLQILPKPSYPPRVQWPRRNG
jgi:5-methylcytosine-specific restriction endonuclease McrA